MPSRTDAQSTEVSYQRSVDITCTHVQPGGDYCFVHEMVTLLNELASQQKQNSTFLNSLLPPSLPISFPSSPILLSFPLFQDLLLLPSNLSFSYSFFSISLSFYLTTPFKLASFQNISRCNTKPSTVPVPGLVRWLSR